MKNKPDLFVTLTIIYLALLTVCIAIYAILQLYVKEIDRGTATNLMIWSATLFPSIALLYTFNSWRDQKGKEVLSKLSEDVFFRVTKISKLNDELFDDHRESILNRLIKKVEITESQLGKELVKKLEDEIESLLEINYLIYKHTHDDELKEHLNKMYNSYNIYIANRFDIYIGMKTIERTEHRLHSIAIDKNDDDEYRNHIEQFKEDFFKFKEDLNIFANDMLKHIFYKA